MRGTMMTDKALKVAAAPKKKKRRGLNLNRKRAMMGYLFVLPFIIGLITFFLVPLIQSFIFSINKLEVVEGGYNLLPVGLSNYNRALRVHATYARDLVESVLYMLTNVPLIIIFSFFAANLLNQKFKGRSLARAIFFLPVILTSGVMLVIDSGDLLQSSLGMTQTDGQEGAFRAVELARLLLRSRLSPTFIDYIISAVDRIYEIVSASGVQILVFLAGLQSISPSLFEASNIEGATGWENFWKITFPMVSPLILVNTVYSIIDSLTNSSNVVMGMIRDTAFASNDYGLSSAMAWLYFLAILVIVGIVVKLVSKVVFYYE
ncbi:MAG: sugar ABC transporter permease [Bacillota bacterium]|nr:sugar ABC transporter permease [Bacillota bacterium]HOA54067.1 sugar ABC transporter permease [Clostridiales bacterium]HQD30197.1 sugar ABC transporter permease [Clostridiales bacterium]